MISRVARAVLRALRRRVDDARHGAARQALWALGGVERALQRRGVRPGPAPFPAGPGGGALVVVAHPDDDLLFLSPDILADLRSGAPFTTVYVTSGDSGRSTRYLRRRELGVAAAYAWMVGVPDLWSTERVLVEGRTCVHARLRAAPQVGLVFLRLPDGLADGRGTARSGRASLQGLLLGQVRGLRTVAHPVERYTAAGLESVLARLMTTTRPRSIRTLDCANEFGSGDHSDHHAVARWVRSARDASCPSARLLCFVGYPVQERPANIAAPQLAEKTAALARYAEFDPSVWHPHTDGAERPERRWLGRQYLVCDLPGVPDAHGRTGAPARA